MTIPRKRRALRGDHNQCPACAEYFNSTYAFDKHRIGAFGVDRRCMTVQEMRGAGMVKSKTDWWLSAAYEPDGESLDGPPKPRSEPDMRLQDASEAMGEGVGQGVGQQWAAP